MALTNSQAQAVDQLIRFFLKIPHQYTHDLPTPGEAQDAALLLNHHATRTGCAGTDPKKIIAAWPWPADNDPAAAVERDTMNDAEPVGTAGDMSVIQAIDDGDL